MSPRESWTGDKSPGQARGSHRPRDLMTSHLLTRPPRSLGFQHMDFGGRVQQTALAQTHPGCGLTQTVPGCRRGASPTWRRADLPAQGFGLGATEAAAPGSARSMREPGLAPRQGIPASPKTWRGTDTTAGGTRGSAGEAREQRDDGGPMGGPFTAHARRRAQPGFRYGSATRGIPQGLSKYINIQTQR